MCGGKIPGRKLRFNINFILKTFKMGMPQKGKGLNISGSSNNETEVKIPITTRLFS